MGRASQAILLVLILLLGYLGAYVALLRPADLIILDGASGYQVRLPAYRMGGPIAQTTFEPLFRLDRQLRPSYWAWKSLPYGSNCMIARAYSHPVD
jgi:hypothetical protein